MSVMSIREWLRKMIGWDDVQIGSEQVRLDMQKKIDLLSDRIEGQESRIGRLQRQRDLSAKPESIPDWEAEQIAFMSNPDNFKEVN